MSLLIDACTKGDVNEVRLLFKNKGQNEFQANPNQIEPITGLSLLYYVCSLKSLSKKALLEIIELLIKHGAQTEPVTKEDEEIAKQLKIQGDPELAKAFATKTEVSDKFASVEHEIIANDAFERFLTNWLAFHQEPMAKMLFGELTAQQGKLLLRAKDEKYSKMLTAGEVVCLSGDFYGANSIEEVISFGKNQDERDRRFEDCYYQLANADPKEVENLVAQINSIVPVLNQAIRRGEIPSTVYKERGYQDDWQHFKATRSYPKSDLKYWVSRYVDLLFYNFDHFGNEAKEAYKAGHRVACETAMHAKNQKDLQKALAQELFAAHFLTDLFSAGHMRTPRRELYYHYKDKNWMPLTTAAAISWKMHDEDSSRGLKVTNGSNGNSWTVFGDHHYFDPKNEKPERAIEAVFIGLKNVFLAYCNRNTFQISYPALNLIPMVSSQENFSPLLQTNSCGFLVTSKAISPMEVENLVCGEHKRFYVIANNQFYFVDKTTTVKTETIACNQLSDLLKELQIPTAMYNRAITLNTAQLEVINKYTKHKIELVNARKDLHNLASQERTELQTHFPLDPRKWFSSPFVFFNRKLGEREQESKSAEFREFFVKSNL